MNNNYSTLNVNITLSHCSLLSVVSRQTAAPSFVNIDQVVSKDPSSTVLPTLETTIFPKNV